MANIQHEQITYLSNALIVKDNPTEIRYTRKVQSVM